MNIDLKDVPTPQLKAIRQILVAGVPSQAETEPSEFAQGREQLCHKSPPKGYPKNKSDYGDPECYRYPLDTKSRCLAAWRYVHHADNKAILGKKFKSVESRIKSYAKRHYNLDLQVGESDEFDWAQAFVEYYDSETMGERCDSIVLESDSSEEENMEDKEKIEALESELKTVKATNETLEREKETLEADKTALEEKASQVDDLTKELNDQKEELEALRKFKSDTEEAAEKAERLKTIKTQLEEAGIEADVEAEADYWLNMSEEVLKVTISKMGELKKGAKASASIKVPQISSEDDSDAVETVREGLNEMKKDRK